MWSKLRFNLPSEEQIVSNHSYNFNLYVKREDLIHPLIKGNKYRKLKYNLEHYFKNQFSGIISFGGAYSNHLHALAATCQLLDIPSIGIVRGEEVNNEVLDFCRSKGMELKFVSRSSYKTKNSDAVISSIINDYSDYLLIPEGGSNEWAIKGVEEIVDEFKYEYDYVLVAAGTGCTAAGIIKSIHQKKLKTKVIVFSALKGGWMKDTILQFLPSNNYNFEVTDEFCLGGYAKVNKEYMSFLDDIQTQFEIKIDKVYNGKLIYGMHTLNQRNFFESGSKILWINSGGV